MFLGKAKLRSLVRVFEFFLIPLNKFLATFRMMFKNVVHPRKDFIDFSNFINEFIDSDLFVKYVIMVGKRFSSCSNLEVSEKIAILAILGILENPLDSDKKSVIVPFS